MAGARTSEDIYDVEKVAEARHSISGESAEDEQIVAQIRQEKDHEVKYRTCSWQKVHANCWVILT